MEPQRNDQLTGFFEDPWPRNFSVVMRGYDRIQTILAIAATAAALSTAACGSSPPKAAVLRQVAIPAKGNVTAAGAPRIVRDTDKPPAANAAAQQTDPNGRRCASLDGRGYCPGDDPSSPAITAPAGCAPLTESWLGTPIGTNSPISQVIHAVQSDAASYLHGDGATYLNALNSELGFLTDPSRPSIPECADPQGLYGKMSLTTGTLLGDALHAAKDAPGSQQATVDCQAVLSDYEGLEQELTQTAPGAHLPSQ